VRTDRFAATRLLMSRRCLRSSLVIPGYFAGRPGRARLLPREPGDSARAETSRKRPGAAPPPPQASGREPRCNGERCGRVNKTPRRGPSPVSRKVSSSSSSRSSSPSKDAVRRTPSKMSALLSACAAGRRPAPSGEAALAAAAFWGNRGEWQQNIGTPPPAPRPAPPPVGVSPSEESSHRRRRAPRLGAVAEGAGREPKPCIAVLRTVQHRQDASLGGDFVRSWEGSEGAAHPVDLDLAVLRDRGTDPARAPAV
jgi:hypothetical protein